MEENIPKISGSDLYTKQNLQLRKTVYMEENIQICT